MARQIIGIGAAPNDGTGDTLRDAMDKVNDNCLELYNTAVEPTAFYFSGRTFRMIVRSGALCIDQTITATGFAGAENTDWANVIEFILP